MNISISEFKDALKIIYSRLRNKDINWAITGSFGIFIQGVPIKPQDIDIITNKQGIYEIEKAFIEFVHRKVVFNELDNIRSYFCILEINKIKIEIMGEIENKFHPTDNWMPRIDWEKNKKYIKINKMKIPVLDLEYECTVYRKLKRIKQAGLIKKYLNNNIKS